MRRRISWVIPTKRLSIVLGTKNNLRWALKEYFTVVVKPIIKFSFEQITIILVASILFLFSNSWFDRSSVHRLGVGANGEHLHVLLYAEYDLFELPLPSTFTVHNFQRKKAKTIKGHLRPKSNSCYDMYATLYICKCPPTMGKRPDFLHLTHFCCHFV